MQYDTNSGNELILDSVIAWSFYPRLIRRDGKGWKNLANNQPVSLHPTSVNKGAEQSSNWLSYYHIMQSSNKAYNAHETSPVEAFAMALLCGDVDIKMYSGVLVIDSNRIRFSVDDGKVLLAFKLLRHNLQRIISQYFRKPGTVLSPQQQSWMQLFQDIFSRDGHNRLKLGLHPAA